MSAKKTTQKSAKRTTGKASARFTAEERAAMKETARERKLEATKADWEKEVLAKIAEMPPSDRAMAKRLHETIKKSAPTLSPKTWYGMPAYTKDDKVVCFFQSAAKFNARYATFGFNAFALKELTAADEAKIAALVKKAVS
jgi:hypothetical protein